MDALQVSQRACWEVFTRFSSSIVFANALIQQAELSVTVWNSNWAEIASTQVNMCENTRIFVLMHLCLLSVAVTLLRKEEEKKSQLFENETVP